MEANRSEPITYAEGLSLYGSRITVSRTRDEASAHAAAFLSTTDSLLVEAAKRAFHNEAEYLWATFPIEARTLENYRKLVLVLLAQAVDFHWYSRHPRYYSERDVTSDVELYSFRRGDADFEVKFVYVQYYGHLLMRIPNSIRLRYRRMVNHPGRYTQGLRITRCKKAMVGLINQISEEVASEVVGEVDSRKPFKVMVNSVLRTVEYQTALAGIGYIAPRQSAHLAGYGVDVEKLWYSKYDGRAHKALSKTLGDLFERGVINLIEEESHWHVCLNPGNILVYEKMAEKWIR